MTWVSIDDMDDLNRRLAWLRGGMLDNPCKVAHLYREIGLGVVPIKPGSKRMLAPLCYPQCFERLPTAEEVESWWQAVPDAQVGIALGVNQLRVLDFEHRREYTRFQHLVNGLSVGRPGSQWLDRSCYNLLGLISKMPKVSTHNGIHLYFRAAPDFYSLDYQDIAWSEGDSIVNLLFEQRYVLAPPSSFTASGDGWWHRGQYGWWDSSNIDHISNIPGLTEEQFNLLLWLCGLLGDGVFHDGSPYRVDYADWLDY